MNEIATGYESADPVGICGWCWRTSYTIVGLPTWIGGQQAPGHLTCILQMNAVRKRVDRNLPITGRTVAERRFLRLLNIAFRDDRRLAHGMLGITAGE